MEAVATDVKALLTESELDGAGIEALRNAVYEQPNGRRDLEQSVYVLSQEYKRPSPQVSLRLGIGYFLMGRFGEAADHLNRASDTKERFLYAGRALRESNQIADSISALDMAAKAGLDKEQVAMEKAVSLARAGDVGGASAALEKANSSGSADYHYHTGMLADQQGLFDEAIGHYHKALEVSPEHVGANFRLAYCLDLNGEEGEAIKYYQHCCQESHTHTNALINMSVLYEDEGRYREAKRCLDTILAAHPNHPRAQLFLKDVNSSLTMFYDEESEHLRDQHNAILDTPISDFELSVRSRTCLKRMNVRTLGDLLKISEPEMLAYKNFGETSLNEIKAMLTQKNLRLGQLCEQDPTQRAEDPDEGLSPELAALYNRTIIEIELSVRSRKCLQWLGVETVGDLCRHTEAELLGCKNFGMTSLTEVKQQLGEMGLTLRTLDDESALPGAGFVSMDAYIPPDTEVTPLDDNDDGDPGEIDDPGDEESTGGTEAEFSENEGEPDT